MNKKHVFNAEFLKTVMQSVSEDENGEIFEQLEWLIEKEDY
jgi:hypothetical protein